MILLGVAVSVCLVVSVGLLVARRVGGDSTNFLVAGRSLSLPLAGAALMGQAVDTNATLGNTDLSAGFGFWAGASLPIGLALCLLVTGVFFAKPMNRMGLTTLPDFYRQRYGRGVEVISAILMMVAFAILIAGNLVAGGYLFEHFLGTPYEMGVLLIVGLVLAYTAAGGMLSDAYTALVQMALTLTAALVLLAWVAVVHGITLPAGMGPFDLGQLSDPAQGAPINWATLAALAVGDIVAIDFMQRIFSARSPETARRACFVGAAGATAIGVPFALVALSSHAILGEGAGDGPVLFTLLEDVAPMWLAVLVLSGIVAASMSTANGAILGTAAVAVRNIGGVRRVRVQDRADPLLRATRWAMVPVVVVAVAFAIQVPQTGILLTLAFDLLLACLAFPFILGMYWRRGTTEAALVSLVVGLVVRLSLFAVTPTVYGAENTILYVPNDLVGAGFDGWPTLIAAAASLGTFVVTGLLTSADRGAGVSVPVDREVESAAPRPPAVAPAGAGPVSSGGSPRLVER